MTNWSPKTKPTPANIRKRLQAALEALEGAETLCEARGGMARTITAIRNAQAWVGPGPGSAIRRLRPAEGVSREVREALNGPARSYLESWVIPVLELLVKEDRTLAELKLAGDL